MIDPNDKAELIHLMQRAEARVRTDNYADFEASASRLNALLARWRRSPNPHGIPIPIELSQREEMERLERELAALRLELQESQQASARRVEDLQSELTQAIEKLQLEQERNSFRGLCRKIFGAVMN